MVDAAGNFGDLIHRLYTTPQYVPVSRKACNTLEIDTRDDSRRLMPFEFGKSLQHDSLEEAVIRTSYHNGETILLRC